MKIEEIEKEHLLIIEPSSDCYESDFGREYIPKLLEAAKCLETLVHNFEELQKMTDKNYYFDFTPNMVAGRKAIEDLEKE